MGALHLATISSVDGSAYAYLCQDGKVLKDHSTLNESPLNTSEQRVNIRLSGMEAKAGYGIGTAVELAGLEDNSADYDERRHIFLVESGAKGRLYYFQDNFDKDATAEVRQVKSDALGEIKFTGDIGVSSSAFGAIVTGFAQGSETAFLVVSLPWQALTKDNWMKDAQARKIEARPLLPASDSKTTYLADAGNGAVSSAVYVSPTDGKTEELVWASSWLARKSGANDEMQLFLFRAPIGDNLTIAPASVVRDTTFSMADEEIRFPALTVRADSRVDIYFVTKSGNVKQMVNDTTSITKSPAGNPWAPDTDSSLTYLFKQMSKNTSSMKDVKFGENPFGLIFYAGQLQVTNSSITSGMVDVQVPLYVGLTYWSQSRGLLDSLIDESARNPWKRIDQIAQAAVKPRQQLVLGIIEGAPPIPNENLNLPLSYDQYLPFGQPGWTEVTLLQSINQMQEALMQVEPGVFVNVEVRAGYEQEDRLWGLWGGKFEFTLRQEFAYKYKKTASTQISRTSASSFRLLSKVEGEGIGSFNVQPVGGLVVLSTDWTGYSFRIVDPATGQVSPNTVSHHTVFPYEPSMKVMVLTYGMQPDAKPYPGNLMSYLRTPAEKEGLTQQSTVKFVDAVGVERSYVPSSWSAAVDHVSAFEYYQNQLVSNTQTVDLLTMFGEEAFAKLLGVYVGGQIETGVTIGLKWSKSKSKEKTIGIGVDLQVRGNINAPNVYTHYAFATYQLKSSKEWMQTLLSKMAPGPSISPDQFCADSAPWLVTYELLSWSFNPAARRVLEQSPRLLECYGGLLADAQLPTGIDLMNVAGAADVLREQGSQPPLQNDAARQFAARLAAHPEDLVELKHCLTVAMHQTASGGVPLKARQQTTGR